MTSSTRGNNSSRGSLKSCLKSSGRKAISIAGHPGSSVPKSYPFPSMRSSAHLAKSYQSSDSLPQTFGSPSDQSSLRILPRCHSMHSLLGAHNIPASVGTCSWFGDLALNGSEKETMQFLNDRLANYLEKVRQLEREKAELEQKLQEWSQCQVPNMCSNYTSYFNTIDELQCKQLNSIIDRTQNLILEKVRQLEREKGELEQKLQEWSQCQVPNMCFNYTSYFNTIDELQCKILCSKAENSRLAVQVDNAKLATDELKTKYKSELYLRQLVEADINSLHKNLDDLSLAKCDLESRVESLKEEIWYLKKNHEQEVHNLQCQLGDKLRIELDTAPPVDLNRVLGEMRCQYEAMLETNRNDVEQWFITQCESISLQEMSCSEELQCCQSEILELKRSVNALEVELQAQHKMKDCLENSLTESETRYSTELAQMQYLISNVEEQLAEIRADLERQNQEYQVLLDLKARLVCEISTYRNLLEREDRKLPCNPCATSSCHTLGVPALSFSPALPKSRGAGMTSNRTSTQGQF